MPVVVIADGFVSGVVPAASAKYSNVNPAVLPAVIAATVIFTEFGKHAGAGFVIFNTGFGRMVTVVVDVLPQSPFEKLYVTVYVPGVLAPISIAPVDALMDKPAGALA